jgi:hypothetical protein
VKPLFEASYLIVAGRFWLRYAVDGGEATLWLVPFDGGAARREPVDPAEVVIEERRWTSPWWDLSLEPLAPGFDLMPAVLRPVAKTHLHVTTPAAQITGRIGDVAIDAVGHGARLEGTRRPERFGWAHAALADGRYVDLLSAEQRGLPRVAFWANERELHNGPMEIFRTSASIEPQRLDVGPYRVEADPARFVGVTYEDPDGRPLYCYHSERARLRGPGVDIADAAFEYAVREELPGWPISL